MAQKTPETIDDLKFNRCFLKKFSQDSIEELKDTIKNHIKVGKQTTEQRMLRISNTIKELGLSMSDEILKEGNSSSEEILLKCSNSTAYANLLQSVSLISAVYKNINCVVFGEETEEKQTIAKEKKEIFEALLKNEKSFFLKMDQNSLWTMHVGSSFVKVSLNEYNNLPYTTVIQPDRIFYDLGYSDIQDCPIVSVIEQMPMTKFNQLCKEKYFEYTVDQDYPLLRLIDDSDISEALHSNLGISDEQEGLFQSSSYQNIKEFSNLKVCYTYFDYYFEEDIYKDNSGKKIPRNYKITSLLTKKDAEPIILRIDRNWINGDPDFSTKDTLISYAGTTSFDGIGYGIANYGYSSLSNANTLLNQIVKQTYNGTINAFFSRSIGNFGQGMQQQNTSLQDMQIIPITSSNPNLPIDSDIMPFKVDPLNQNVYETLKMLNGNILNVGSLATEKLVELAPNVPFSTIASILDKEEKPTSNLIARFEESYSKHLEAYNRLLYLSFKEDESNILKLPKKQIKIYKHHFDPDLKIIPIAHSSLKVSSRKFLIAETMKNIFHEFPDLHEGHNVLKIIYQSLGLSDQVIDQILTHNQEIPPRDPITENECLMRGIPVKAYPYQDQDAYIFCHLTLEHAQGITPQIWSTVQAHIGQRQAYKYMTETLKDLKMELPEDLSKMDPKEQNKLAVKIATKLSEHQKKKQSDSPDAPDAPEEPTVTETQAMMEQAKAEMLKAQGYLQQIKNEYMFKFKELEDKERKFQLSVQEFELEKQKTTLETQINNQKEFSQRTEGLRDDKLAIIKENNRHHESMLGKQIDQQRVNNQSKDIAIKEQKLVLEQKNNNVDNQTKVLETINNANNEGFNE